MDHVVVDKNTLVDTIKENRDAHRDIFLKAQERYKEKMVSILEDRLLEARRGVRIDHLIRIPVPEDHTADFDTVLNMLGWEVGDSIELSMRDFRRYVENDWEWNASFAASTEAYLAE